MLGRVVKPNGDVHEGELLNGRLHGLGVSWNKLGTMLKCGRWDRGDCCNEQPVPRSQILIGTFLPAAGERHSCTN